ncbi:MAG: hypothetical protein MUF66_10810 [Gammaproteobacteria bacterium]|nr:hypothetical protein [Gammaproteobacteria bacterium]
MASGLSTEQLASLRERLQRQFADLRERVRQELIGADAERFLDLAGRVHDPGDESVADLLVDLGLAAIDRHIGAIRETEAGILRLRRGTYGSCVDRAGREPLRRLPAPARAGLRPPGPGDTLTPARPAHPPAPPAPGHATRPARGRRGPPAAQTYPGNGTPQPPCPQ